MFVKVLVLLLLLNQVARNDAEETSTKSGKDPDKPGRNFICYCKSAKTQKYKLYPIIRWWCGSF